MTPEERVRMREWVEDVWSSNRTEEEKTTFLRFVFRAAGKEAVLQTLRLEKWDQEEASPMTDDEVRAFEKQMIPFGKHKGSMVRDLPLDYLCWLTDGGHPAEGFLDSLKRYLLNPQVKTRLREEQELEEEWDENERRH